MKQLSVFMILTMLGTISFGQVIFQVQAPSTPANLQASYSLTYDNQFFGNTWGSPDLTLSINSVTAPLEFVDDGDIGTNPTYGHPNSEDACTPFGIAGQPLAGKIAVLYRGDCQFGWKARHAQNAGAVAVVIINHSGAPVGMNGGDSGLVVTIPVIMVSTLTGQFLEAAIHAGTITQAFIGNKEGIFANDLGIKKSEVLRSRRFSSPTVLAQNASEFSVQLGAWVRNHGNTSQSGGTLTGNIDLEIGGTNIYNQSASIPSLAPGDSAWVSLPTFSQSFYLSGYYDMSYIVTTNPIADEENSDNTLDVSFMLNDSLYSYSRLDPITWEPMSPAQTNGSNAIGFEACMAFQDPNAWRVIYQGMNFTGLSFAPNLMANEYVEARVYQWDDVFVDNNDAALDFANLVTLDAAFFVYQDETLNDVNVFVPRDGSIWNGYFVDNQRYLFCINSTSTTLLIGFSNSVDYTLAQDSTNGHHQPSIPAAVDQVWYLNGFGLDFPISASVQLQSYFVGLDELTNELNIVPFPNPAIDVINIPVGDRNGSAALDLYDVTGKLVISQIVTFNNNEVLTLDVSDLSNGSYVGEMVFEDTSAKFNVVINK
jgi:hypothetical protein